MTILIFFSLSATQRWVSGSTVICRKPYGISTATSSSVEDSAVIVTIHIQVGTLTDAFTFPLPVLTGVPVGNAPTVGATTMQFSGLLIGSIDYCPRINVGSTAAEAIGWISDSSLAAKVAAGASATLVVDVTVGTRSNFLSQAASYDIPDIVAPTFSYFSVALFLLGASPVCVIAFFDFLLCILFHVSI